MRRIRRRDSRLLSRKPTYQLYLTTEHSRSFPGLPWGAESKCIFLCSASLKPAHNAAICPACSLLWLWSALYGFGKGGRNAGVAATGLIVYSVEG